MSKIICRNPFFYCDIGLDGNVYVCCNKWCSFYSIGNILKDDLNEILYGEKIQKFIEQFTSQKFEYCRIDMCMGCSKVDDSDFEKYYDEFKKNEKRLIRLNFDTSCNLQCIFCRQKFETADSAERSQTEKLIERIKQFLPELDKNNCEISLNGVGEVFVSKPFLDLIKHITSNYKNIKFQIITNGILCSEKMLKDLGIINRISGIEVSVHAYKAKTYNKLVNGGDFKKLKKNLEYISRLKKENKITKFQMNFAINAYNYREMLQFAKWGISLGAFPAFLQLLILDENKRDNFDRLNVVNQNHPEYNNFVKIIKKLKPIKDNILIPEHYFELSENKPEKKSLIKKLFFIN